MTESNLEFNFVGESDAVEETKEQRFTRVVNQRLAVAVERLRLIEQMFSSSGVSAYEFTPEQVDKLEAYLCVELQKITTSAHKVLDRRAGKSAISDMPQL